MKKEADEIMSMSSSELILKAARAASVTPDGKKCRFTLRDVKRELKPYCSSSESIRYRITDAGKDIANGRKISAALIAFPELYTAIYNDSGTARRRIVGFRRAEA